MGRIPPLTSELAALERQKKDDIEQKPNSNVNLRKTTIYNTNVDLVNEDLYAKYGPILSIHSQVIE